MGYTKKGEFLLSLVCYVKTPYICIDYFNKNFCSVLYVLSPTISGDLHSCKL